MAIVFRLGQVLYWACFGGGLLFGLGIFAVTVAGPEWTFGVAALAGLGIGGWLSGRALRYVLSGY